MTIVAAMKFSDRICVLSDTMITDHGNTRHNIIPGRLKSIVINEWLTISYAGLSTQAMDAVRELYRDDNLTTAIAIDHLINVSGAYGGELDFILCSHENETRLVKVSNGKIFEGGSAYWIGNGQAAAELSNIPMPDSKYEDLPDYIAPKEMIFKNTFHRFMRTNRCEGVGGAIIDCLCSPYGHCYITHASAFSWDTIILGKDDPTKREALNKTGMYHYEYNVCSTSARGQAIVGFYLGQAGIGFIYDPVHDDEAMRVENINTSEFSYLVEDAGKVLANSRKNNKIQPTPIGAG
ncbi:hypothetical protein FGL86_09780 [Pistricoccus aurantiacus]|uniref:Uncharacterized protein n=1 Tax=Pistricoccus aurantiacus TaxID=1883414 RepID=A0A5B8STT3_9GAMM|nr:hypothetical protein [Pistricoccus aurantiacus]QEA39337.1 hypothetical protein FGL86_09780 [Pistricoccus aurantiacus]